MVYQIVLTKADKISAADQERVVADTRARLAKRPAAYPDVILTSSETGLGLDELRGTVATLVDLNAIGYKA